jgi:hypothetical protein
MGKRRKLQALVPKLRRQCRRWSDHRPGRHSVFLRLSATRPSHHHKPHPSSSRISSRIYPRFPSAASQGVNQFGCAGNRHAGSALIALSRPSMGSREDVPDSEACAKRLRVRWGDAGTLPGCLATIVLPTCDRPSTTVPASVQRARQPGPATCMRHGAGEAHAGSSSSGNTSSSRA